MMISKHFPMADTVYGYYVFNKFSRDLNVKNRRPRTISQLHYQSFKHVAMQNKMKLHT